MNKILLILIGFGFSFSALAQLNTLSPYSIYGIGDASQSDLTSQASMGHTGIAIMNPLNINTINPAGLSQLSRVSFNLDVKNELLRINNGTSSQSSTITGINNVSFAFPLINNMSSKRRSSIAFGIKPYTSQGYEIESSEVINGLGSASYRFVGDGGITDAFLGFSYDLFSAKKENAEKTYSIPRADVLSLGVSGSYLFGTLDQSRITDLSSVNFASSIYRQQTLETSDASMKLGFLYAHALTKTDSVYDKLNQKMNVIKNVIGHFSLGAFYSPSTALNTFQSQYNYSFVGAYTNPTVIDTLLYSNQKTSISNPASYGFGLGLGLNDQWTFGLDFVRTEWSKLEIADQNQSLKDASRISFGTEYIPDINGRKAKLIRYRAGLSFAQTRLELNGRNPSRYGINFGIGVPLIATKSTSMFNVGVGIETRGNTSVGLTENFVNLHIGFTFTPNMSYDFWFLKRKYD